MNLENGNSTLLLKDCINDPTCNYIYVLNPIGSYLAYLSGTLYIANKSCVFVIDVQHQIEKGQTQRLDVGADPLKV